MVLELAIMLQIVVTTGPHMVLSKFLNLPLLRGAMPKVALDPRLMGEGPAEHVSSGSLGIWIVGPHWSPPAGGEAVGIAVMVRARIDEMMIVMKYIMEKDAGDRETKQSVYGSKGTSQTFSPILYSGGCMAFDLDCRMNWNIILSFSSQRCLNCLRCSASNTLQGSHSQISLHIIGLRDPRLVCRFEMSNELWVYRILRNYWRRY